MRCAHASSSNVSVVVVGSINEALFTALFMTPFGGYATTRVPPGVDNGAFVACGSAGRGSSAAV